MSRLSEDDPEPGQELGESPLGFVDEGGSVDALKCVGEVEGEEAKVEVGGSEGKGNFV